MQADGRRLSRIDFDGWKLLTEKIRDACDPIVQFGIASARLEEKFRLMELRPEMMSYAFNVHDDQFDLAEACLSVAIALAGVTALTRKRWLFGVALGFASLGTLYGLAGFLHWRLHSDLMAKLLG